ncbi:hypothetical protein GP2_075_00010, partial [Gordonia paraffinivorans NBRC 108238]
TYQTHMQSLLSEIVHTHGLLIAGWSAAWDKALRETVMREYRPFYTPAWITPNSLEPKAQEVVEAIGASVLPATADQTFTRLADAVDTLQARSVRHPVTAQLYGRLCLHPRRRVGSGRVHFLVSGHAGCTFPRKHRMRLRVSGFAAATGSCPVSCPWRWAKSKYPSAWRDGRYSV